MKRSVAVLLFILSLFAGVGTEAAEKAVFGPQRFDVTNRYGLDNRFIETIPAAEGLYEIRVLNGAEPAERTDLLELSMNGETLLKEGTYDHRFISCFVKLRRENTLVLVLKDFKPAAFKRPPLIPKNVTITIVPAVYKLTKGVLGLHTVDGAKDYAGTILKIRSADAAALALTAASLQNDVAVRAAAARKLADRKDPSVQDFFVYQMNDYADSAEVRGESARGLGMLANKAVIPILMAGVLDPEELVRNGCVRALALYPEEDTRVPLSMMLERMDPIRKTAVVRALVDGGWRPISTLIELAGSPDPSVANLSVALLIGSNDQRVVEFLLNALSAPGPREIRLLIPALGATRDPRANAVLATMAKDPAQRIGLEAEIGMALADIGDPGSAALIAAMIRDGMPSPVLARLLYSYKKLTGQDYQPAQKQQEQKK